MEKKLKIGIIGCGGIANGKHMPSLAKLPNVEMVAFCDIIVERAEKAAKDYGTEDAKVYADYKEMLADCPEVDVIHVCTPNKSHGPITVASLEAGKHVMCEKPMAKTVADAKLMLEVAKRTGKKLTIGYQNRQTREMRHLKKMCEAGVFGDIYFGKAHAIRRRAVPTWGVFMNEEEQGGGPLIDIGTHALDLTLYMMDNYEVESVSGNCHYKLGKRPNSANAWGPWDPEKYTVEDSAFGFIKMKNGATIILESSWAINLANPREATCTLAGTEAGVDFAPSLKVELKQTKPTEIPSIVYIDDVRVDQIHVDDLDLVIADGETEVTATATVYDIKTGDTVSAIVIIAGYDADGKLVSVSFSNGGASKALAVGDTLDAAYTKSATVDSYVAFLWDDLTNIRPYVLPVPLSTEVTE